MLKTAGGYLLVLHTLEENGSGSEQCVRLMQEAKEKGDWDLCKELARFLMALDESGEELRMAVELMAIRPALDSSGDLSAVVKVGETSSQKENNGLKPPRPNGTWKRLSLDEIENDENAESVSATTSDGGSRIDGEMG